MRPNTPDVGSIQAGFGEPSIQIAHIRATERQNLVAREESPRWIRDHRPAHDRAKAVPAAVPDHRPAAGAHDGRLRQRARLPGASLRQRYRPAGRRRPDGLELRTAVAIDHRAEAPVVAVLRAGRSDGRDRQRLGALHPHRRPLRQGIELWRCRLHPGSADGHRRPPQLSLDQATRHRPRPDPVRRDRDRRITALDRRGDDLPAAAEPGFGQHQWPEHVPGTVCGGHRGRHPGRDAGRPRRSRRPDGAAAAGRRADRLRDFRSGPSRARCPHELRLRGSGGCRLDRRLRRCSRLPPGIEVAPRRS